MCVSAYVRVCVSERERKRRGGSERERRAAAAPLVLAPEARRAQRTVPASLDGAPQPGGGTSLPPLSGNQCREAAVRHLTAVSLVRNFFLSF